MATKATKATVTSFSPLTERWNVLLKIIAMEKNTILCKRSRLELLWMFKKLEMLFKNGTASDKQEVKAELLK